MALQFTPIVVAVIVGSAKTLIKRRLKTRRSNEKCLLCNRKTCTGAKVGGPKKGIMKEGSSTRLWAYICKNNNWESNKKHPWNYGDKTLQAHHLIPLNAFNTSNNKGDKESKLELLRIGDLCAFNVDHWKNGVVLPNKKKLACYLQKPRHAGGHDRLKFGYTNACVNLTTNKISQYCYRKRNRNICHLITNSNLLDIFNKSSRQIFNRIKSFTWPITSDSENYNPLSTPYKGCSNSDKVCNNPSAHTLKHVETGLQVVTYVLEIGK